MQVVNPEQSAADINITDFLSVPELFQLDLQSPPCLIDKFLWEGDNALIIAPEKSGKSILSFQMALALVSGKPFLGSYKVLKPVQVAYIHTEGKIAQTRDWLTRMLEDQSPEIARQLFYKNYPSLSLDTREGLYLLLADLAKRSITPKVMFFDSLYHCMKGKLTDDLDARRFTESMRVLIQKFDCSIVINHHFHRDRHNKDGELIEEGDNAIFGSFVWKAHADHTFRLKLNKKTKHATLDCETQRSGEVITGLKLRLQQPNNLGFIIEDISARGKVLETLNEVKEGCSCEDIEKATRLSKRTIYRALDDLLESKQVTKNEANRPVIYSVFRK